MRSRIVNEEEYDLDESVERKRKPLLHSGDAIGGRVCVCGEISSLTVELVFPKLVTRRVWLISKYHIPPPPSRTITI